MKIKHIRIRNYESDLFMYLQGRGKVFYVGGAVGGGGGAV